MTRKTTRTILLHSLVTVTVALGTSAAAALGATGAPAARVAAPLPATAYQVLPVCRAPTPDHAGCLALELAPRAGSSAARALSAPAQARAQRLRRSASPAQLEANSEPTEEPTPVTPAHLHSAYGLPDQSPAASGTQTIALVDAYNDPHAETDLAVYDRTFGLPECTFANGCFEQVNQKGETGNLPFPTTEEAMEAREAVCKGSGSSASEKETACAEVDEAAGWTVEISTDIDVAHSVCQNCHIRLVEARSSAYPYLEKAELTAARALGEGGLGATEISNSWGGEEPSIDSTAFAHRGIVITAAAGDDGYLNWTDAHEAEVEHEPYYSGADYPASSPHVVAVGGTKLTVTATGARQSETVWNEDSSPEGSNQGAGGGGCSAYFKAPSWQLALPDWSQVGCGSTRAVADISADGDPVTGVLVYDSSESQEYLLVIGGTSVASPIIASAFALAGGAQGVEYPAQTLYTHLDSESLYDVLEGGNGECDGDYASCSGSMDPLSPLDCGQEGGKDFLICNAAPGYDGPTGVGTPNGIGAFKTGNEEAEKLAEEKQRREKEAETRKAEEEEEKAAAARKAEEEKAAIRKAEEERAIGQGTEQRPGTSQNNEGATIDQSPSGSGDALTGAIGAAGLGSSPSTGGKSNAHAATVRLTGLALTIRAIAALDHNRPWISHVAFRFTLSVSARVRITLAKALTVHGHLRWATEPDSFTSSAPKGRDRLHCKGRLELVPGRYRLTLAPAHGSARSLVFVLG